MKIVFLQDDFPPMSFGGAGISTYELALGMVRAGHDVSVITTCREEKDTGETEYQGLRVFNIASNYNPRWRAYVSIFNFPVVRQVEQILTKINPDVVQVNNVHFYLSFQCLKVAKRCAKAVVFTARDVMTFNFGKLETKQYLESFDARTTWVDQYMQAGKRWNPFRNYAIQRYLRYADRIFAISESLQKAMSQNGIDNVGVIYNGLDTEAWYPSEDEVASFKVKYHLEEKKVLLFSGRLSASKGGSHVLDALSLITQIIPNTVLVVVGTVDTYARTMQKKAESLNITKHLIFTGWMDSDAIKIAYAVSDIVLMPSICFDAFGRVNIEAMATKKPVVGTRYGGTPEIVEDGVTGYIIDPRNPEEIAQKIIELLKNPERAKQFGEAGYKRVKEKFNLEDKVEEYIVVYESLCNK